MNSHLLHSRTTKAVGVVSALTLGLVGLSSGVSQAATGDVAIDLAAISDFHGQIDTAAALDFQIDAMRTANPNTRFVSAGDSVGGSAYVSSIDNDTPTLEILKAMQLSVTAAGNHEFDKGYKDLVERIKPALNIPVLAANLVGSDELNKLPYYIEEIAGVKVAYIGTVTDEMPTLVSADAIKGLSFTDPVAATNKVAEQLKDGNDTNGEADVVVALIHKDIAAANQLGSKVDIAFAGHSHLSQTGKTASGAPTCQTVNAGKDFAKAHIVVSADHKTVTASCSLAKIDPKAGESEDIKKLYETAKVQADALGKEPVGTLANGAWRGATNPDPSKPGDTGIGGNRGTESSAGNLLAEAFYQYSKNFAKPAQIGLMNPGGVRADLTAGELTKGESYTVQPFGNVYGTKDLTGAQLYKLLEQQWKTDPHKPDSSVSHPVLRLGLSKNVKYVYDPAAPFGKMISEIYVDGQLVPNDSTKIYTVASNTFLLAGGDGFTVLKEGTGFVDTGMKDNEAFNAFLADYNAKVGSYVVDYSQRSYGLTLPADFVAGTAATIEISSMSMTAGEAKATQAEVSIEGVGSQTVTLDNTITPKFDETGRGKAVIAIPANIPAGTYTLKVRALLPNGAVSEITKRIMVKAALPASGPRFADDAAVRAFIDASGVSVENFAAVRGQKIDLVFQGLPANASANVYFYSLAKLVATQSVGADGVLKVSYTLPQDIALGTHYAVAQTANGSFVILRIAAGEAPGVGNGTLAETGAQNSSLTVIAVLLVLSGLAVAGIARRAQS
ncbi:bifunctional metallophosphatase/5'-nucleotidase [Arcanobacterium bovis]|uniref:Bifunctional metallophosphatase/5'-nucleotidase n=1 Tax=Arcanobacterium bovis TaxID=2529275 RepID=A0A4Q9V1A2_9ACTO|nr:bifunctional UDP-sugar hydrolase/5'-nucleotidase [Arcanobacterium bovis]TBW21441.1 bifunctional metallophosphatase/5'-nucleotidase [Arcanobacterium bovis]